MLAYQKIALALLGLLTLGGPLFAQHARFANAFYPQPMYRPPVYVPQQMFYGYPPQRTLTGFTPVVGNSSRNLQAAYARARQPKLPVVRTPVARFARQPARMAPPRRQPPPQGQQPPRPTGRGEGSGSGKDEDAARSAAEKAEREADRSVSPGG
jgi:hypothetical protein